MNRSKTDFLCATSSFLMGMGSVLNVGGHLYDYNSSSNPDEMAIANDWKMIGQDISDVLGKFKMDFNQKTAK